MNKTSILYIIIFLIFTLGACEQNIDVEFPKTNSELAVFGFISPEDTITEIIVKQTIPYSYYQEIENEVITDAQVEIINNNNRYVLPFDEDRKSYYLKNSELEIKNGQEYSLEVSAKGFPKAKSSITVNTNPTDLKFIKQTLSPTDFASAKIKVSWQDKKYEKNFYRLMSYVNEPATYDTLDSPNGGIWIKKEGPYIFKFGSDPFYLYNDAYWDGEVINSNDMIVSTNYSRYAVLPLHICLLTVDYHYYQYHKSINTQRKNGNSPFAESTIIYSNIENGVGVFCSYRKKEIIKVIDLSDCFL